MSNVGVVLGGGGITGAAYEFAALMAVRLATGWDPADADVMIGTSAGAMVSAAARGRCLTIEALTGVHQDSDAFTEFLQGTLLRRTRINGFGRWVRHGLLKGARRPGLDLALGGPAPLDPAGVGDFVEHLVGPLADSWPASPTYITTFELESRTRVVFGAPGAPVAKLRDAVAASWAVPMVYQPVEIDGKTYVDGGVASGTNMDLLLEWPRPLDLILVIAPMASDEPRRRARFYEAIFDRVGRQALQIELELRVEQRPQTDLVVLRPGAAVLAAARPNPMSAAATIPTFLRTLAHLRRELARPEVWAILERHLVDPSATRTA